MIDSSPFNATIDKIKIGEHYYSSKPPVLAWFTSGLTRLIHTLAPSLTLIVEPLPLSYWIILLAVFNLLPYMVGIWAAYRILELFEARHKLMLLAAISLGGLWVSYLFSLTNHVSATGSFLLGLYFLVKARHSPIWQRGYVSAAGVAMSAATVFEISLCVWWLLIAFYLWREHRQNALVF